MDIGGDLSLRAKIWKYGFLNWSFLSWQIYRRSGLGLSKQINSFFRFGARVHQPIRLVYNLALDQLAILSIIRIIRLHSHGSFYREVRSESPRYWSSGDKLGTLFFIMTVDQIEA